MYLSEIGFHFSRALGQNFLLDDGWNARIVELSGVKRGDAVLEIGPGAGTLTRALCRSGARVLAVEIDRGLEGVLTKMLAPFPDTRLVFADIGKIDPGAAMADAFGGAPYRVVSNLPYAVAAELLPKLAGAQNGPVSITAMVQLEAAQRVCSRPGEKNWCLTAARMQYYCAVSTLATLPPSAFTPNAHVESALLRCDRYAPEDRPARPRSEERFLRVMAAAFAMRRKTMANNLTLAFSIPRERALSALEICGLAPAVRGETLSLAQLAALSDALAE